MSRVQTFTSPIGESYQANRDANKFIEENNIKIINIRTTSNNYYFYITIWYEKL